MDQTCRCSLDRAAFAARVRAFGEILALSPAVGEPLPGGRVRMTLDLDEETHDRLADLAAAEAECCPWLGLAVGRDRAGRTTLDANALP